MGKKVFAVSVDLSILARDMTLGHPDTKGCSLVKTGRISVPKSSRLYYRMPSIWLEWLSAAQT